VIRLPVVTSARRSSQNLVLNYAEVAIVLSAVSGECMKFYLGRRLPATVRVELLTFAFSNNCFQFRLGRARKDCNRGSVQVLIVERFSDLVPEFNALVADIVGQIDILGMFPPVLDWFKSVPLRSQPLLRSNSDSAA
jgi:hypothetical protein